ncbi:cellulose biosynthesis protein BcsQ [Sodalis sp. C49]|uniref:cellulose biosynthesis protein BcsQ n=1 Tax=unclassified Sodalis (in: enterobacteria) TaxID=2636512 RepID=UPI003965C387
MPVIALRGIRGATGTTSVAAGLSWALAQLGENVLAIDFSPDNLLRLHFAMPFSAPRGWASAVQAGAGWQHGAMRYSQLLDFLPFGRLADGTQALDSLTDWRENIAQLKSLSAYHWIVLDVPAGESALATQAVSLADGVFTLLQADAQCHVRLHQQSLPRHAHYVVNQFVPASALQQDLLLLWQQSLPNLLPVVLHRDEAMAESLAALQPVGAFMPHSKISQELTTLANWCLIHLRNGEQ